MSHCEKIRSHLERHGSITPMTALRQYGCYRLSARIMELRDKGYSIDTEMVERRSGARHAKYVWGE